MNMNHEFIERKIRGSSEITSVLLKDVECDELQVRGSDMYLPVAVRRRLAGVAILDQVSLSGRHKMEAGNDAREPGRMGITPPQSL